MDNLKIAGDIEAFEACERIDPPHCADHDEDCEQVEDKLHCWLYDPGKGMCPYLRAKGQP